MFDDMPDLVDANSAPGRRMGNIPPPPGATYSAVNSHAFPGAFAGPPRSAAGYPGQFGHGPPPSAAFPSPHVPDHLAWQQNYPREPPVPSPYIPRHNPFPENHHQRSQSTNLRRHYSQSTPSSMAERRRVNSVSARSPWRAWDDESPSFDVPSAGIDRLALNTHSTFPNTVHTPSSTLSRTASMGGYFPSDERPGNWRRDFKFRSGLSSMFRLKGSNSRTSEISDSSKLSLHPYLRHDRGLPPAILDLRQDLQTLTFHEIDHPVTYKDLAHSCTIPPTPFMRIYHSRLPWYIDIHATNSNFISIGDFFIALYASLYKRIHRSDYWNDELDETDRNTLRLAWTERCRTPEEKADGVKRVDFLRGKTVFEGLVRGKNGMWQLKTGREKKEQEFSWPIALYNERD